MKDDVKIEISIGEIEKRTAFAKMQQLELSVEKERLALDDKARNLCRIDLALSEFDTFLVDFVQMLDQLPDKIQAIVTELTPDQYQKIQNLIEEQIHRMGEKRLHLALESTKSEREKASEIVNKSRRKSAKLQGIKGGDR